MFVAFFALRPAGKPGPAMRDFEAFYAAGATANLGADPYGRAVWDAEREIPGVDGSHDEMLPFVGPPAMLPLWRALAHLPYDAAGRVWGAILAIAMLVVVFGSLALARAPRVPSAVLGAAIFAGSFGALTSDVALGQPALLSAAAIVATLLVLRSRAWPAAALTSAIAALQPNLCLVLIARACDIRALAGFTLGAVLFGALMLHGGGVPGVVRYLHLLGVHGAAEARTVIQITPAGVLIGFGADAGIVAAVRALLACLVVFFAVFGILRTPDPVVRVGIASCALPFVVSFFHEHDFVIAALPALVCAVTARGRTLAFAALAATACGVDWLGLGQRSNAELQSIVLATANALGFILTAQMRRESLVALATPCVVACVGFFAQQHHVPIWPDALPAHWRAPAGASISEIWALEQRISGLDAASPVWASLRALALASSALLGFAVYLAARGDAPLDIDVHEVAERIHYVRTEPV